MKNIYSRKIRVQIILIALFIFSALQSQSIVKYYTFEIKPTVDALKPSVKLEWTPALTASSPKLYKRKMNEGYWTDTIPLKDTARSYIDTDVVLGETYEYGITRTLSYIKNEDAHQYAVVCVEKPLVDYRGKLILLVEKNVAPKIKPKTDRLVLDLIADGWQVIKKEIDSTETVANVKTIIKNEYNADKVNVKSVFILGHIPIPFSGYLAPDGHEARPWPTDGFYGDMDGVWTDTKLNISTNTKPERNNIPGDGKLDQNDYPSTIELQTGRVDMYKLKRLKTYDKTLDEVALLNRYLDKDHLYRTRLVDVPKRGLLEDIFDNTYGEMFAASTWGAYFSIMGYNSPVEKDFFDNRNEGYLWGHASGPGSNTSAGNAITTDLFSQTNTSFDYYFLMIFGSYFGEWSPEDNLMRTALGSKGHILSAVWSGRPYYWNHYLGAGETLGKTAVVNQDNSGYYYGNYDYRSIHIGLLGDPTLRMYMIAPPTQLQNTITNNHVVLSWTPSPDDVEGYHVYKASNINDKFSRITTTMITENTYTDPAIASGNYIYIVKAIKKEKNNSGTWYNSSRGAIISNIDTIKDADIRFHHPLILKPFADTTILENLVFKYDLKGHISDPEDSTDLKFVISEVGKSSLPKNWIYDNTKQLLSINKTVVGTFNFVIKATNSQLYSIVDTFTVTIKSINEEESIAGYNLNMNTISVYPNPSNGNFSIELNSGIADHELITVCDITGKIIFKSIEYFSGNHKKIDVDLSTVEKGIYIIIVESPSGTYRETLIIQ